MSSIINISQTAPFPLTAPTAQAKTAAPAAPPQPTLVQLLDEPMSTLRLQAEAGNPMAIQLLAQDQETQHLMGPPSASSGYQGGSVNLYA